MWHGFIIHLSLHRDQGQIVMKTVMELPVPLKVQYVFELFAALHYV